MIRMCLYFSCELPVVLFNSDDTSGCSETSSIMAEPNSAALPASRSHGADIPVDTLSTRILCFCDFADFLMTSSPCEKSPDDVTFLNPPSPVSMLLGGGVGGGMDTVSAFSPVKLFLFISVFVFY